MNETKLQKQLEFLRELDKVKQITRQTLLMDGSRHENDAEHSWHASVAAMLLLEYANESIDLNRIIKMLLLHDTIEIYSGDTYAYDTAGIATQHAREQEAADKLFAILPEDQGKEFRALWEEFEAEETDDAQFARSIDCFMPLYHNYLSGGKLWHKNDVHEPKVRARLKLIYRGSKALGDFASSVVDKSVELGYLPR